jgi:hypothetical protein
MTKILPDTKISSYIPNLTSVLCPTRNRPGQLIAMMQSCLEKASNPNLIEFCLYIDNDDFSYDVNKLCEVSANVKIVRGPKMSLSSMFNSLLTVANGEFFFWSGDDVSFQSSYWDESLKLPLIGVSDRLGVAHANDLASYEQKYATIGMVHYNWVALYGYVFTPHMKDNGIDFWISEVARKAKRLFYCPEVMIEHLQYRQGKSVNDETYRTRRKNHETYDLIELYRNGMSERRRDSLLLLQKLSQPSDLCKGFLISGIYSRIKVKFDKNYLMSNKFVYLNAISDFNLIRKVFRKILLLPPPKMS